MGNLKENIKSYVFLKKRKNEYGIDIIKSEDEPSFKEVISQPFGYYCSLEKRIGILIIDNLLDENNTLSTSFIIDFGKIKNNDKEKIQNNLNTYNIYQNKNEYLEYINLSIISYKELKKIIEKYNKIYFNSTYKNKIDDLFSLYQNNKLDMIEIILLPHENLYYSYTNFSTFNGISLINTNRSSNILEEKILLNDYKTIFDTNE